MPKQQMLAGSQAEAVEAVSFHGKARGTGAVERLGVGDESYDVVFRGGRSLIFYSADGKLDGSMTSNGQSKCEYRKGLPASLLASLA